MSDSEDARPYTQPAGNAAEVTTAGEVPASAARAGSDIAEAPAAAAPTAGFSAGEWEADILGPGFVQRTLEFPQAAGPSAHPLGARATLVKHLPHEDPHFPGTSAAGTETNQPAASQPATESPAGAQPAAHEQPAGHLAVLYVHGWSDYFFNRDLARMWASIGAEFYAIDMRNYGRSLDFEDPAATPGMVSDLAEYAAEFAAATSIIAAEHPERTPVIHAHSTGGLSAALWVEDNPGAVGGLILNSPWLEFQMDAGVRKLLTPLMKTEVDFAKWQQQLRNRIHTAGATAKATAKTPVEAAIEAPKFDPLRIKLPNYYTLAVAQEHGRLPFDATLKPPESFPVYPQFLSAVFTGHQRVANGLNLQVPVLMQTSKTSIYGRYRANRYTPDMASTDIVLDVEILAQRALKLADQVTIDRIPGAMHDIFLSAAEVREDAFARIMSFARGYLPPR